MWDVKVTGASLVLTADGSFTLTMWDVKSTKASPYTMNSSFYLNYVGCKVMGKNKLRSLRLLFYLNYVGCKVSQRGFKIFRDFSFTLTMWDVKRLHYIVTFQTGVVLP